MSIRRGHILCFVFFLCSTVMCDVGKPVSPELQELRKRWGASDIIRDLDHIKQDVQKITELQDSGDITTNEALFYFLRMHDFDDNRKLDGHELLAAMSHALEHHDNEKPMSIEEKENIVDSFFAYDDNNDGLISYPELRKHLSREDDSAPVPQE